MKLKKTHFEQFKKHCNYYIKKYELNDWNVVYEFKKLEDTYAESKYSFDSHGATITLANEWGDDMPFSQEELKSTAKHEVLHLFLGNLTCLAYARYTSAKDLMGAEHGIINKLIKFLPE